MLAGKDGANVTGSAPPPVSRARVPGFPAAARRPADRACVGGVLHRRRFVRRTQGHQLRHRPVLRTRRPDRAGAGVRAHRRRRGRQVPAAASYRRGQRAHGARRRYLWRARADQPTPVVGDDRAGGHYRDRSRDFLSRLPGPAPPPRPARPAAGGERDQPDGDEHRPDVGRGRAGLLVAAAGAGWALVLCGIGMVSTVPLLLSIRGSRPDARDEQVGEPLSDRVPGPVPVPVPARLRRRACSPNCARAGRSSVRTRGYG